MSNIVLANYPCEIYRITSEFGVRVRDGKVEHHNGIDLGCKDRFNPNEPIRAVNDGIVRVVKVDGSGINNGFGRYIVIEHDGWCTLYAHLDSFNVKAEQNVKAGQQIGIMGKTGDSDGVHLHFEIRNAPYSKFWNSGKTYIVNPKPYLDEIAKRIKEHWGKEFLDLFVNEGLITNPDAWSDFDTPPTQSEVLALSWKVFDKLRRA